MESVQDLINVILWDRRLVISPNNGPFVILNPTVEHRNKALLQKSLVLQQAISSDTPTEQQIMEDAKVGGSWTEEDELVLREGEKFIALLEEEKSKQKFLTKKRKLEEQIVETKERLKSVLEQKQYFYTLSAEYIAYEAFVYSLIEQVVYSYTDNKPFFNIENPITSYKNSHKDLIGFLVKEVMSEGLLPFTDIRKVARSVEWRMLWTLNRENLSSLFNIPVSNLSANQKMLIYWSRVYDLAYESTERPDEDVIQDDNRFDIWLQNRNSEMSSSSKKQNATDHHERGIVLDGYYVDTCTCEVGNVKAKGHGEKPRHRIDCNYGRYVKYTKEEKDKIADEIYHRNSATVRSIQTQEQNKAIEAGMIDEKDLINKKTRLLLGSKQKIHRIQR